MVPHGYQQKKISNTGTVFIYSISEFEMVHTKTQESQISMGYWNGDQNW